MAKYYGVQRSEEYLEHYGVKGMKWGVRRALKAKTGAKRSAKLQRQYIKASDKLVKLKRKEMVAGAAGAKAGVSKYRATPKGHAKAVDKRQAWEKEMKSAFKGTKYASLPDAGPIIAKDIEKKHVKRNNAKKEIGYALKSAALSTVMGPAANYYVNNKRAANNEWPERTTKTPKKKKRS